MKKIGELGLLNLEEREWQAQTYAEFIREYLGLGPEELKVEVAKKISLPVDSEVIKALEWLGLFSAKPLPARKISPLDLLVALMVEKMQYKENERDLTVLQHQIVVEFPGRGREKIISRLIDFGQPGGHTSMSRTVGLPVAIGLKLILENRLVHRGVLTPTLPEIYTPILEELKLLGISFTEERSWL